MRWWKNIIRFISIIIFIIVSIFLWLIFVSGADGGSMQPTYPSDYRHHIRLPFEYVPKKNDVVTFDCLKKCSKNGKLMPLFKRVIDIDRNDCIWVEGDNKSESYDSRNFGWICPADRAYTFKVLVVLPF
jgi:hypothetical protein